MGTCSHALAYGIDYRLDLFSNFTYFANAENGGQFEQFDSRNVVGTDISYSQPLALFGKDSSFTAGVQIRHDDISPVGLYLTQAHQRYDTVRQDEAEQTSYSAYLSQSLSWTDWFRTEIGARVDEFRFKVDSKSRGELRIGQ